MVLESEAHSFRQSWSLHSFIQKKSSISQVSYNVLKEATRTKYLGVQVVLGPILKPWDAVQYFH